MEPRVVEVQEALREIAHAFDLVSRGFERLAGALTPEEERWFLRDRLVVELWHRLGVENRALLVALASNFSAETTFTLEEASDTLLVKVPSLRARLMNMGRSLRSMGADLGVLWDTNWTGFENEYRWSPAAYATIMELAEK